MIVQLHTALQLETPKGKALAHFVIDYGIESPIYFVCFLDDTGECWTFSNEQVRAQKNISYGRTYEKACVGKTQS